MHLLPTPFTRRPLTNLSLSIAPPASAWERRWVMRTSLNGAPFSSSMSSEPLRLVPTRVTHGIVLYDGSLTLRVLIAERRRCRCMQRRRQDTTDSAAVDSERASQAADSCRTASPRQRTPPLSASRYSATVSPSHRLEPSRRERDSEELFCQRSRSRRATRCCRPWNRRRQQRRRRGLSREDRMSF